MDFPLALRTPAVALLQRLAAIAGVISALLLSACGGGGGGQLASGGIVGTGDSALYSVGTITATAPGTITVNAVAFAVSAAVVTVNGQPAVAAALKTGMVVTVQGLANANGTATAQRVDYRAEVQGVVSGVDNAARSFVVVGQNVRTDALTVFDGGSFATLVNQYVEVSGFRSTPGELLATRVEVRSTTPVGTPVEVTGALSGLDPAARLFDIGSLRVDYAQVPPAFVPAGLANGATVRVRGSLNAVGDRLLATDLAIVATTLPAAEASKVELEGFIAAYASLASFTVNGQAVDGRTATIEGGSATDLRNGVKVEVEGRIASGVVVATKIEIEAEATSSIDGLVQSVNAAAGSFVVAGQVIAVNATTQFEDKSVAALSGFGLAALRAGDRVAVKAALGQATLIALRVERLDLAAPAESAPEAKAEGSIANFVSVASFDVGGRRVNASSATFVNGTAANLANGRRVEVEGVLSGSTLLASRVTFGDEGTKPPGSVKIEGTITGYVSRANFRVAGQLVDASGATIEGGSAAELADGRTAQVEGLFNGTAIVATRVGLKPLPAATALEISGTITAFASSASFKVAGQSVDASRATFSSGAASDLADGRKVTVKGTLASGVLNATDVRFEDSGGGDGVSAKGKITNFVSVSNFKVATRTIDASAAKFEGGSAGELANGVSVEVKGTLVGAVLKAREVAFD